MVQLDIAQASIPTCDVVGRDRSNYEDCYGDYSMDAWTYYIWWVSDRRFYIYGVWMQFGGWARYLFRVIYVLLL